jgi:hypothetical protein
MVGVSDNEKCVSVTQWYVCVCPGECVHNGCPLLLCSRCSMVQYCFS